MWMLFLCDSGYYPRASLILKTGQPVMPPDGSVILRLDNDGGLRDWKCYVFKKEQTSEISLMSANDSLSFEFQPYKLVDTETIFWCANRNRSQRSNQVTIRTSGRCSSHAASGEAVWKFHRRFGTVTFTVVQHRLWFSSL